MRSLPDPRGYSLEQVEAWRINLFRYLSAFCPAAIGHAGTQRQNRRAKAWKFDTRPRDIRPSSGYSRHPPATIPLSGTAPSRHSIATRSSIIRPGLNGTVDRSPTMTFSPVRGLPACRDFRFFTSKTPKLSHCRRTEPYRARNQADCSKDARRDHQRPGRGGPRRTPRSPSRIDTPSGETL